MLNATTIAKIATAANVSPEYAATYAAAFASTAAQLVVAGETTLENLDMELVQRVMQDRLDRLFSDNFEAIATEVWGRVNAA